MEEVYRVIEFLEVEEVEVYEKFKILFKKGIKDFADVIVCYSLRLLILFLKYFVGLV